MQQPELARRAQRTAVADGQATSAQTELLFSAPPPGKEPR
jgi:hypothetical protein